MDRYHRQSLLPQIGREGQARLAGARVAVLGCGALGTVSAELLARAGVGFLRLIDRDLVELTNLQRQTLYAEADVGDAKAAAAAQRLGAVNSAIALEPAVVDVHSGNILALIGDVDLVLDGTDNADTRYLLNDAAVRLGKPWVYGGAVGTEGRAMLIRSGHGPCLRCLWPDPPAAGELPTCDTAGVLATASATVGVLQANFALRHLVQPKPFTFQIAVAELWPLNLRTTTILEPNPACPACQAGRYDFLDRPVEASQAQLCGQDAVQIRPARGGELDLAVLGTRLASAGAVQRTPFLLRCDLTDPAGVRLTVFRDGRAILSGVRDVTRARSLYARYVGM
jgi:molybdopterin/thiamine biosynthesis adenylyltransferase